MGKVIRYLASMLPIGQGLRARLYGVSGIRVGALTIIDRNVQVTRPDMVTIGSRVTICNAVSILGEVTAVHSRLETAYSLRKTEAVVIEDDAYIGVKATILPGVRIGRMATVGANTLVIADVPDYGVVLGVPGRVMMIRPHGEDATAESGSGGS
jgi:acetyltransferase-like isoleucine patch superfamily enzyme